MAEDSMRVCTNKKCILGGIAQEAKCFTEGRRHCSTCLLVCSKADCCLNGQVQDASAFIKTQRACKTCRNFHNAENQRQYRKNNPAYVERMLEANRLKQATPEGRAYQRSWAKANKDKIKEYGRTAYYERGGKERQFLYARQYKASNKEKIKEKMTRYRENNRASFKARESQRRANKRGAKGTCSPEQMMARAAMYGFECAYCKGPWENDDHVIPLKPRQGEPQGTNFPANMRPSCKRCNVSKLNKPLKVWLARKEKRAVAGRME